MSPQQRKVPLSELWEEKRFLVWVIEQMSSEALGPCLWPGVEGHSIELGSEPAVECFATREILNCSWLSLW